MMSAMIELIWYLVVYWVPQTFVCPHHLCSTQRLHTSYGMSRSVAEAHAWACTATSGGLAQFIPLPLWPPDHSTRQPRLPNNVLDHIIPNSLRPLVLTPDQFTEWLTPYGIAKMDKTSCLFPTCIIIKCRLTITNCVLHPPSAHTPLALSTSLDFVTIPDPRVRSHASFGIAYFHVCFHSGGQFCWQKHDENLGVRSLTLAHH